MESERKKGGLGGCVAELVRSWGEGGVMESERKKGGLGVREKERRVGG